jgi:hypothetical protein
VRPSVATRGGAVVITAAAFYPGSDTRSSRRLGSESRSTNPCFLTSAVIPSPRQRHKRGSPAGPPPGFFFVDSRFTGGIDVCLSAPLSTLFVKRKQNDLTNVWHLHEN